MKNRLWIMAFSLLMLVLMTLIVTTRPSNSTNAEVEGSNMKSLLQHLDARMRNEDARFSMTIWFAAPLRGGETIWMLPESGPRQITIAEVGDDFACFDIATFDILTGTSHTLNCTPLSNIVNVSWSTD
jgi:hypothetical protein